MLAWRRTVVSALTVSMIAAREIILSRSVLSIAVFAALLATTVAITVGTVVRIHRFMLDANDSRAMPMALMTTVTAGVTIAGLVTCTVIQL